MLDKIKNLFQIIKNFDWNANLPKIGSVCRWFNLYMNVYGIPTVIHWTVLALILVFLLFNNVWSAMIFALVPLCILPHEYGHVLVARKLGIKTRQVVMYPIGGVAQLEHMQFDPITELKITIAGPLVSAALCAFGFLHAYLTGSAFWQIFGMINLMVVLFNLVPAFPMDGGRILRSGLCRIFPKRKATIIACKVSKVFCILFLIASVILCHIGLALIAVFVYIASNAEQNMANQEGNSS